MDPIQTAAGDPAGTAGSLARFEQYLRARNLRMTPERRSILETILSREGHFDADELLAFLRRKNRRASRATLYRTLEHLREAGLVKQHRFGKGHALYEHVYGRRHHDHMVCDGCGRVFEFVSREMERLQEAVCREQEFLADRHVMAIFGLCASCRDQEEGDG